jgi:hypothetical protein
MFMLGASFRENIRVLGEEMVGENGTRGGGIVTCENKELYLSHGEFFERRVDACSGGILGEVGFRSEVNDGLVLIVWFALNGAVTTVEFVGEVTIHSAFVVCMDKWPEDVDMF